LFTRRQSAILSEQWSSKLVHSSISLLENPLATDVIKTFLSFWTLKFYYLFQPLFLILSQIYLVFTLAQFFFNTYFHICLFIFFFSSSLFHPGLLHAQVKLYSTIYLFISNWYQLLMTLNLLEYYWFSLLIVSVVVSLTVWATEVGHSI
jgi:hypothetical protein